VVAVVGSDGTHHSVVPGSWWEMQSSSGELWCTWVSEDGEQRMCPRHRIRRVILEGDSGEDFGFA
jgi:hypothetical protein